MGERERERTVYRVGYRSAKNSIEDLAPSRSGTLFIKVPRGRNWATRAARRRRRYEREFRKLALDILVLKFALAA